MAFELFNGLYTELYDSVRDYFSEKKSYAQMLAIEQFSTAQQFLFDDYVPNDTDQDEQKLYIMTIDNYNKKVVPYKTLESSECYIAVTQAIMVITNSLKMENNKAIRLQMYSVVNSMIESLEQYGKEGLLGSLSSINVPVKMEEAEEID